MRILMVLNRHFEFPLDGWPLFQSEIPRPLPFFFFFFSDRRFCLRQHQLHFLSHPLFQSAGFEGPAQGTTFRHMRTDPFPPSHTTPAADMSSLSSGVIPRLNIGLVFGAGGQSVK